METTPIQWEQFKVFGKRFFEDQYMKTNFDNFDQLNRQLLYKQARRLSMETYCGRPNLHHMFSQPMYQCRRTRHLIAYNVAEVIAPQPAYRAVCIHNPIFAKLPSSVFAWVIESMVGCEDVNSIANNSYLSRLIVESRPRWFRNRFGPQGDYLNMGTASQIYTPIAHVPAESLEKIKPCPVTFKE